LRPSRIPRSITRAPPRGTCRPSMAAMIYCKPNLTSAGRSYQSHCLKIMVKKLIHIHAKLCHCKKKRKKSLVFHKMFLEYSDSDLQPYRFASAASLVLKPWSNLVLSSLMLLAHRCCNRLKMKQVEWVQQAGAFKW